MSFQILINYSRQQNVHAIYIYREREIEIDIDMDIDVFQIVHHLFNNLKQHKMSHPTQKMKNTNAPSSIIKNRGPEKQLNAAFANLYLLISLNSQSP